MNNALALNEWNRVELSRCLLEASSLPGIDQDACAWLRDKLQQETFNLVVAGEFKRGKSSIINALLGEPVLPVGVVPLTSVITVVQAGAGRTAQALMQDGHSRAIALEQLAELGTEPGNPGNVKGVRQIIVDHPSDWLQQGIRIIDTPGIGSPHRHNTEVTRAYLPQADAVLFVASVDQPVSQDELHFLDGIRRHAEKIFCLLNKVDHLAPAEQAEALAFATEAIRHALGTAVPVFPVSARLALEAKRSGDESLFERSGFVEFQAALREFIDRDRADTWLRSVARSLTGLIAHARHACEVELNALSGPLDLIQRNLSAFQARRDELHRSRADHRVLLEADARALLREDVEPALERFKQELLERLPAHIDAWFARYRELPSRQLQAELEKRIIETLREAYDGWLAQQDLHLAQAFDALCRRFWSELQRKINELMRYSSELFALSWTPTEVEGAWSAQSRFYYKFWYEPTGLRMLSTSLALSLPKALAGRLIMRYMKALAAEFADTQAGRLRHDLEERLKQSVRDAQRKMTERADAIIAQVEAAIERALETRRESEPHITARRAELSQRRDFFNALEARVLKNTP